MNILVVDDEPALRQLIRRFLIRDFQVRVLEADDGVTALEQLRREKVDVVLLDVTMKAMGGIETLEAIRSSEKTAQIPVVLMTAQADEQYVRRAAELGIADFLVKPFTPRTLCARMSSIIGDRASVGTT
jgi:DNA-binding response OmpR family regulator